MTSNIFYQSAPINFSKDKKTFAFAVIIIKQLLTKQFSMNISSRGVVEWERVPTPFCTNSHC